MRAEQDSGKAVKRHCRAGRMFINSSFLNGLELEFVVRLVARLFQAAFSRVRLLFFLARKKSPDLKTN